MRRFLSTLGPGLVTGASDDDPSGIGTYAQAGAALGLASLWTTLVTFPMMWTIQFVCAKIGMVTGGGLARVLRKHYSPFVLYPVVAGLAVANTINAGVDIGAIAAAINLIVPVSAAVLIVPIVLVILSIQIFGSYRLLSRIFKWLTLALFAYIVSAFFAKPDWRAVAAATFLPTIRFDREYLLILVAILGTTITPYLFFWQADQEVEEEISMGRRMLRQRTGATQAELRQMDWDVAVGMLFSNAVMFFIMLATASTLHTSGKTTIQSATDAAEARREHRHHARGIRRLLRRRPRRFRLRTRGRGPADSAVAAAAPGRDPRPRHARRGRAPRRRDGGAPARSPCVP